MHQAGIIEDCDLHENASGNFIDYIDNLLRHRDSCFKEIFENRNVGRQISMLLTFILCVSTFYGAVMGSFGHDWRQILSAGIKVPMLYLLTLLVCFPLLYVINVLMGSKLRLRQTFALILIALAINCILLGVCSPIALVFQITGSNYHFIKLLHVAIFGLGALWGMIALWRGLIGMCEKSNLYPKQAIKILQVWMLIFGFVGTQMAWSLRPYVGAPDKQWEFVRTQESNFYVGVWISLKKIGDD
jgi:membrane-bound ClpP family serine protease